jgi:hypothetical protein
MPQKLTNKTLVCQRSGILDMIDKQGYGMLKVKKIKVLFCMACFAYTALSLTPNTANAQLDESLPIATPLSSTGGQRDSNITTSDGLTGGNAAGGGSATIADQTCDSQVWRTMEARARMETEREIMQNQNLIFKPDSILNYVCFDKFAGHASEHVGVLFTHTTYWNGQEIIKWGDQGKYKGMDKAMQAVVIDSMKTYVQSNFNHEYLGGRGPEIGLSGKPPVSDITGKGGTYGCSEMSKVWAAAKCMNFLHTNNFANNDGFYPFLNLRAQAGGESVAGYETKKDVRKFPTACTGEPFNGTTWMQIYRKSRNENGFGDPNDSYKYGEPNNRIFTKVREKVDPGRCANPAIKTGVKIIKSPGSTSTTEDGVCTNPGCTYSNGSCSSSGASYGNTSTSGTAAP